MDKYINATAAIKAICGEYPKEQLCNGKAEAIAILEKMPAADVEPIKRGRWIEDGSGVIICSECGEEHEWQDYRAPYCDTCGAKMEVEEW